MGTGAFEREVELFRQHGGGLRMSEALRLGINRKTLTPCETLASSNSSPEAYTESGHSIRSRTPTSSRSRRRAPVRIYDPEKTLADCFRYRNQIGMDVVLEAMRLWRERRRKKLDALLACNTTRWSGSSTGCRRLLTARASA